MPPLSGQSKPVTRNDTGTGIPGAALGRRFPLGRSGARVGGWWKRSSRRTESLGSLPRTGFHLRREDRAPFADPGAGPVGTPPMCCGYAGTAK